MLEWLGESAKLFNKFIPGREERIRNKIDSLEKQINEITSKDWTDASYRKYQHLLDELRIARKALENR